MVDALKKAFPVTDTQPVKPQYKDLRKLPIRSYVPILEITERELIFSNREKELRRGIEHLNNHRLLVVTGMPGIGKSTYARALLEFMSEDAFRPFWYNFDRHKSSGNSLGNLLDQLSSYLDSQLNIPVWQEVMSFRFTEEQAAATNVDVLMDFLNQSRPIWLVFDNLETVLSRETNKFLDERLELLFDTLKNASNNVKIIVTNPFVPLLHSGEPYLEDGTSELTLDGLDEKFEIEFLQAYGLKDIPEQVLLPLVSEINGHPFILNYIARYIRALGVSAAVENLNIGLEDISEQFGISLKKRLSEQEFTALQSLSILNREISFQGLCQIAQVKSQVVIHLREMGLLQRSEDGAFWIHNIVRNSIRSIDSEKLGQAHLRAMEFYRNQTQPSSHQTIDDYASVLEWHFHAVEAGDIKKAYQALYLTGLEENLMKWSEYGLVASLCERILSSNKSVQNLLSSLQLVKFNRTLGSVYFYLGDFSKSITFLETAVDLSQAGIEDEVKTGLLIELAESYNGNREFATALNLCQKAIALLTDGEEDNKLRAKALHLRGIINRDLGNSEQAIQDLEGALMLYEGFNDRLHIGNLSVDLGIVYYQRNSFSKAIDYYRNALDSYEMQEDVRGSMIAHFNIGNIYLQDEKYELARYELQTALEIARKKKIGWMEVWSGLDLVEAQIELQELDNADKELSVLNPVVKKQAFDCYLGQELSLIASLHWKRKQTDIAQNYFKRAFKLLESINCDEQRGRAYLAYASFMKEQGNIKQANEALLKARVLFEKMNNQLGLKSIERLGLE